MFKPGDKVEFIADSCDDYIACEGNNLFYIGCRGVITNNYYNKYSNN